MLDLFGTEYDPSSAPRTKESTEHHAWRNMIYRCYGAKPDTKDYYNYVEKGIIVCDRWRNSFKHFLEDVGPKPSPELTLERINSKKNYEPGNCKWATWEEQLRNTSRNVVNKKIADIIREIYKSGKCDQETLAETFHLGQTTVSQIIRNETWR